MHQNEGPSTRSVHLSQRIDPSTRAIVPPICANAAFAYEDIETWRAVALNQAPGDITLELKRAMEKRAVLE